MPPDKKRDWTIVLRVAAETNPDGSFFHVIEPEIPDGFPGWTSKGEKPGIMIVRFTRDLTSREQGELKALGHVPAPGEPKPQTIRVKGRA